MGFETNVMGGGLRDEALTRWFRVQGLEMKVDLFFGRGEGATAGPSISSECEMVSTPRCDR